MKPTGNKNYGSIGHLSNSKLSDNDHIIHEGQEKIVTVKKRDKHDLIIVLEKYDGSNVGVAKIDNKIYALTRSGYEAKTSPYKQHRHDYLKYKRSTESERRYLSEDSKMDVKDRVIYYYEKWVKE
jgi:hypothetical protein